MGFSLPAKFSQMSWVYFTSPWLTQCFLSGNISVGMKQAKPKRKKSVICFLSFGRYLRIPLAGRGTAELAIIEFYFCYVEFCTFWTFPTVSLPALGYLGWMDTVLGSSSCPCWMSRAPLHPQQPEGSLFNSASVRGSWNFFKPHPLPAASLNTSAERQEEKRRGENITLQGVVIGIIKLAESRALSFTSATAQCDLQAFQAPPC